MPVLQKENNTCCIGTVFLFCFIGLAVCGIILNVFLANDPNWNISAWHQIHYGAYITAAFSIILSLVTLCGVHKAEIEQRSGDAAKWNYRLVGLLWLSSIAMFPSWAFFGGFVAETDIFSCTRNSTHVTGNNTESVSIEFCSEEYKSSTVGCMIFMIAFVLTVVYTCDDRNPKRQPTKTTRSSYVPRSRITPSTHSQTNSSRRTDIPFATTETTSRNNINPPLSGGMEGNRQRCNAECSVKITALQKKLRTRDRSRLPSLGNNQKDQNIPGSLSTPRENSENSNANSFEATHVNRGFRGEVRGAYAMTGINPCYDLRDLNNSYCNSEMGNIESTTVLSTPRLPPLTNITTNSHSHYLLPPIPSYESVVQVPNEPPPSYDEAIIRR